MVFKDWLDRISMAEWAPGDAKQKAAEMAKKMPHVDSAELEACYRVFDAADGSHNGTIETAELRSLLDGLNRHPLSDREFAKIMRKFDTNRDGKITFEEFVEAFMNTPDQKIMHLEHMIENEGRMTQKAMNQQRKTAKDKALKEGVPLKALTAYLRKELAENESCIQLPGTFVLFFSYMLAVLFHEKIDVLHSIDTAVSFDVIENANFAWSGIVPFENGRMGHKSVLDVNTYADFWSWFSTGLVPLFWAEGWEVSEARANTIAKCTHLRDALEQFGWSRQYNFRRHSHGNESEMGGVCPEGDDPPRAPYRFFGHNSSAEIKGTYLYFNTVIGGLRLRQERTKPTECPAAGSLYKPLVHLGLCVPSLDYWLKPELRKGLQFTKEHEPDSSENGNTVFLLAGAPQHEIRQKLRDLENMAWFGPETAKIEIMFTTYNAHVDAMTATYIVFFQNRAGHIHRMIVPQTFWVNPYHGWWCYVADFTWIGCVLKIFLEECQTLCTGCRHHGIRKACSDYISFTNFVDWLNIAFGILLALLFLEHLEHVKILRASMEQATPGLQGTWEDPETRIAFFTQLEEIITKNDTRYVCIAMYPFVLVTRFFKSFASQPRLSLVTNTLIRASVDLVHFGLVFAVVFVMFSFSAQILFGRSMPEFANEGRAIHTTFLSLLGDWDWEDMTEIGRLPATIWFWCYQWLVNMIMLNMLLAIIMDIYTEVKGGIGSDAETFWSQMSEIYIRWRDRRFGDRVSLEHVLQHVVEYEQEKLGACQVKLLTVDSSDSFAEDATNGGNGASETTELVLNKQMLTNIVPGLREAQAERLLVHSMELLESNKQKSCSLSDAMLDIQRIDQRVIQLHESTQSLIHMMEMSTSLMVNTANGSEEALQSLDKKGAPSSCSSDALERLETLLHQQSELLRQQAETQAQQQKVQEQQAEVLQQLGSHVGNLECMMSKLVRVLETPAVTPPLPRPLRPWEPMLCGEPQMQSNRKTSETLRAMPTSQPRRSGDFSTDFSIR